MNFKEIYAKLNTAQKAAVDTIDGPLLVLAGPGTGKTQLLSARVANILKSTDSLPQNILCLTFTDKAATNMKQRLLDMIGQSARKVVVKTFHSLGAEIMNSYPEYFWHAAHLEAAPEAIKLELITKILSTLPLNNPLALKFTGQYTLVDDILKSIAKAKEAGLTPAKLAAVTTANLAYLESIDSLLHPLVDQRLTKGQLKDYQHLLSQLTQQMTDSVTAPLQPLSTVLVKSLTVALEEVEAADGKTTALSKWKATWFETVNGQKVCKDVRRNTWWHELAGIYQKYQSAMHAQRYFDFADMILEVISQLEQNETLRADIQERFNYILIDEFQDTNDAQFRLSYLIANHPSAEAQPNIMAVGDDDQAIYRFQGAQIGNAKQFMDSYKGTQLIVLKENYRSHQTLLDTASIVAEQIEYRLVNSLEGIDKTIISASKVAKGSITHQQYLSQTEEYSRIAQEIAKRVQAGETDIAVLARKHSSLEQLAALLSLAKVPIRYERSNNILDHPLVTLVTQLLSVLQAIHEGNVALVNQLLADILSHPAWELDPITLWHLALSQRSGATNWLEALLDHSDSVLEAIGTWLTNLAAQAQTDPLVRTMEHLLGLRTFHDFTSPLKNYYIAQDLTADYLYTVQALRRLLSMCSEYAGSTELGIAEFVQYLHINREYHVVISSDATIEANAAVVQLMTVYKAKGLEFDTVYIIDANEQQWRPRSHSRTPPSNLESLQSYGEDDDDYARLMFVAMSRARSNLVVASYQTDEQGRETLASSLVHHLPTIVAPTASANIELLESELRWPEVTVKDRDELLRPLVKNYQLSVTALIHFLDVTNRGPSYFIERHLLRLPELKPPSLSFGTSVHSALEAAQRLINGPGFSLPQVLTSFDETLRQEHLEQAEFERYLEHGHILLSHLFNDHILLLKPGDYPERSITDVQIGTARIKGKLDLVQTTAAGLTIVDYKTGRNLKSLDTKDQGAEGIRAWKHRMQLVYYVLLAQESSLVTTGDVISGEMVYIEATDPSQLRCSLTPAKQELDRLAVLVQAVHARICQLDWPDMTAYSTDLKGIQAFEQDLIDSYKE